METGLHWPGVWAWHGLTFTCVISVWIVMLQHCVESLTLYWSFSPQHVSRPAHGKSHRGCRANKSKPFLLHSVSYFIAGDGASGWWCQSVGQSPKLCDWPTLFWETITAMDFALDTHSPQSIRPNDNHAILSGATLRSRSFQFPVMDFNSRQGIKKNIFPMKILPDVWLQVPIKSQVIFSPSCPWLQQVKSKDSALSGLYKE